MSCPSCTLNESIRGLARLLAADQTALIVTDQGPADTTAGCASGSGDRIDSVVDSKPRSSRPRHSAAPFVSVSSRGVRVISAPRETSSLRPLTDSKNLLLRLSGDQVFSSDRRESGEEAASRSLTALFGKCPAPIRLNLPKDWLSAANRAMCVRMKCSNVPCKCEVDPEQQPGSEQRETTDGSVSPKCPCGH
jgi:hypothetical protein